MLIPNRMIFSTKPLSRRPPHPGPLLQIVRGCAPQQPTPLGAADSREREHLDSGNSGDQTNRTTLAPSPPFGGEGPGEGAKRSVRNVLTGRATRQLLALVTLAGVAMANASATANVGVSVPDGFQITLFADSDLANDIFCMTVDSLGRVAVSGPGYVRLLIDENGDGQADSYRQFADGPKTGAQGMYFFGRDLFCVGDAGLIRYRDDDQDDRADGEPDVFLKVKTGAEHHAHAVRKGPDGAWYLLCGNQTGITGSYATLPNSPVKQPSAGTLLRLNRDLSRGEILADGFRNAYDFAFHHLGDMFVYDSDGERDVSLPWYRPTRVFQIRPGLNAGWASRSWKRPGYFADMPPVTAAFGRGSPTGVVCYRHRQFPEEFQNAVFALDWTFGRVMALPLNRNGASWQSEPSVFMTGIGQHGFAPTDAAVGKDGSLFVSVGGRGTRGGVYRVSWAASGHADRLAPKTSDRLAACLTASQPLSSWSRAQWVPIARELGSTAFAVAAINENLPPASRRRAIEILTELYDGLDSATLQQLVSATPAAVRARAIWSAGRIAKRSPPPVTLLAYLNDADPLVARCALETMARTQPQLDRQPLLPALAERLADPDRFVRQAASRVVATLTPEYVRRLSDQIETDDLQARVAFQLGRVARPSAVDRSALETGLDVLESAQAPPLKLEAARLLQLALGDVGPGHSREPVFDGYSSLLNLQPHERAIDPARIRLAKLYPTGDATLDHELGRLIATLGVRDSGLRDRVLNQITKESHPVDDIHQLIVAARMPVESTFPQTSRTARALVGLDAKIALRGLTQDRNWDERIGELYRELVKHDPQLPTAIAQQPGFGRPGHVVYLSELPKNAQQPAIDAFVTNVTGDDDSVWTTDVVFVIAESADPSHRVLLRRQFDHFGLQSAILMVLAGRPEEQDRDKFVAGLGSSQLDVLAACLEALEALTPNQGASEQIALLRMLRRLGTSSTEKKLRRRVIALLQRNTGQEFSGDESTDSAIEDWTAWITTAYPSEASSLASPSGEDWKQLQQTLEAIDWSNGDVARGGKLFDKRSCAQCHGSRRSLGPDLSGVAKRFSRDDLWAAIADPNRDVSPRYQTTMIQTDAGKIYTGLIIYESVDGLILRDAQNRTYRIEADEIEQRRTLNTSLMPTGLLKGMTPQDLSDLHAYLRSLGNDSIAVGN